MLNHTPNEFQQIIAELSENPDLKFKDYVLKQKGMEPAQIRRWFLKNYEITFQAYQRLFRINSAFKKIKSGESVTHTAFDTDFESLSGFGNRFKIILVFPQRTENSKLFLTLNELKRH